MPRALAIDTAAVRWRRWRTACFSVCLLPALGSGCALEIEHGEPLATRVADDEPATRSQALPEEARHCPAACARLAEAGCADFASLEGCLDVCPLATLIIPRACRSLVDPYFECRANARVRCDASGAPVVDGCQAVADELDACAANAPI